MGGGDKNKNPSVDEEVNSEEEDTSINDKDESPSKSKSPKKSKEPEETKSESPSKNKSPKKSKEPEETKSESDEDESEEDSDDEEEKLPPGLLERPYEVEGKREKKKTERMSYDAPKEREQLTIEDGPGVKLGDLPIVEQNLQNTKAMDCKPLHTFLFGKQGTLLEVKKNIRKFSGDPNGKKSVKHEKREVFLNRMIIHQLKIFCQILNLERGGTKQDLVDRLLEFAIKPVDSGITAKVAKSLKRKRSKTPSKKKSKTPKKEKKDKVKKKKAVKKDDDESGDDEESEDEEAPKKKKVKLQVKLTPIKSKSTPTKKSAKKSPSKSPLKSPSKTPSKSPKKKSSKQNGKIKSPKKQKAEKAEDLSDISDDSDSDDEPLARLKEPSPPTNTEIKAQVQKILKGADLETVTMKVVVKQIYGKYPKFDLTDRKDFIKDCVRKIIS